MFGDIASSQYLTDKMDAAFVIVLLTSLALNFDLVKFSLLFPSRDYVAGYIVATLNLLSKVLCLALSFIRGIT